VWPRRVRPEHCAPLGEALARLHLAGEGFAETRPNALGPAGWPPLLERCRAAGDAVQPGLVAELDGALAAILRDWPAPGALPQGHIHADLFPDNVFFLPGPDGRPRVSGLIDFYFACTDLLAYDVAICLNAWCFETDGSFNLTKGQAMLSGYQAVRRLEAPEIEALPILCRGSAMRFMLTRLVDWLNVPPGALVKPKDPLEYDRKLHFHRHVKHAREYGLDA